MEGEGEGGPDALSELWFLSVTSDHQPKSRCKRLCTHPSPRQNCPLWRETFPLGACPNTLSQFYLMLWGILIIIINTHIYRRKMNRIDLARDLVITLKGLCFFPIFQWNTQIPAKWLSNETTLAKCPSDHNICPPQIHKLSIQIKSGFCTNRWALLIVDLRNPNGTGHSCVFPSCHTSKNKIWI